MTDEEIIEIGKEIKFPMFGTKVVAKNPADQIMADAVTAHYHEMAIAFGRRVAEKEREACAKVCEEWDSGFASDPDVKEIANEIRARGQQ